jgi:hypothetical protein
MIHGGMARKDMAVFCASMRKPGESSPVYLKLGQ